MIFFPTCTGKATFDALHAALQGLVISRGNQGMQMIRHDHKSVEKISSLLAVMKDQFAEQGGVCVALKERAAFRNDGGNEIRCRI